MTGDSQSKVLEIMRCQRLINPDKYFSPCEVKKLLLKQDIHIPEVWHKLAILAKYKYLKYKMVGDLVESTRVYQYRYQRRNNGGAAKV